MNWWFLIGVLLHPIKRMVFWSASKLHKTTRPRVAIICKNQILLVQGWGDFGWGMPGGGKHRGESAVDAAARELKEEIGVSIDTNDFIYVDTLDRKTYFAPLYLVKISDSSKLSLKLQKWEINRAEWFDIDRLPSGSDSVKEAINAIIYSKNLL